MKPDKKARITAIAERIEGFCRTRLNDDYEVYAKGLLARIAYLPRMNLRRGRPEIWAAAIVTVIARLNFLFDRSASDAITMDAICEYFGTVQGTTGSKATAIERDCGIRMGEPGLCREEITASSTTLETGDGFIAPLSTLNKHRDNSLGGKMSVESRAFPKRTDAQGGQTGQVSNNRPEKSADTKKKKGASADRQMHLFDDF